MLKPLYGGGWLEACSRTLARSLSYPLASTRVFVFQRLRGSFKSNCDRASLRLQHVFLVVEMEDDAGKRYASHSTHRLSSGAVVEQNSGSALSRWTFAPLLSVTLSPIRTQRKVMRPLGYSIMLGFSDSTSARWAVAL